MKSVFLALTAAGTLVASSAVQAATVTIDFESFRVSEFGSAGGVERDSNTAERLEWNLQSNRSPYLVLDDAFRAGPEFGNNAIFNRRQFTLSFDQPVSEVMFSAIKQSDGRDWYFRATTFSNSDASEFIGFKETRVSGQDDGWDVASLAIGEGGVKSVNIQSAYGQPIYFDNVKVSYGRETDDSPIAAVPLPASVMNLGMGFALIAALPFVRRRKARKAT